MRLTILTPAPDEPRFASVAQDWLARLARALEPQGVNVAACPWTACAGAGDADGVSPLLAWGYHQKPRAWRALLDRLAEAEVPVVNPAATLAWNTRKTYLAELEAQGAPIVPTLFVERLDAEAVAQAHDRFGADIIAKPQVSGGSFQTLRLAPGAALADAPDGPAMLQPFLAAVTGEGELSLVYFNGAFSHAVSKRAAAGDFRVQVQHGGLYAPLVAPPEALAAAEAVLAATGRRLVYARVDLIRDAAGALKLMELEAIEPDLYLEHAPDSGAAFARAMLWALD